MRFPVSLLVITAFLVGCSTDEDPVITQVINVTSMPKSAIVKLNGTAVGRTPTTITVESNSDYQLEVGKGGFTPSLTELKPSLKTDSKGNMFYGFPERISVSLDRIPGSNEEKVPEEDLKEFRSLARKAATPTDQKVAEAGSAESKHNSVAEIKEDVTDAQKKLADRDAASAAKIEGLKKSIAEAKAADSTKVDDPKIAALEAQVDAQEKAIAADRQSTANLLKALGSRTDELIRIEKEGVTTAKAEATKDIEAQKALAAKEAEEKAKSDTEKQLAEAQKSAETRAKAETAKQLAEAQKTAEQEKELARAEADKQLASVQRVMEEQKTLAAKADEQRIAAEQQRAAAELEAKKRVYADFNSRYALLESRRRNKVITEEEFKDQLSALRKELTK
jgi:hypothetical protein